VAALPSALLELIASESTAPVSPDVLALADAARARHGNGIVAVLFYGSCLRARDLEDRIADLYLIAESHRGAHDRRLAAMMNAILPPNVYYLETTVEGRTLRAKYAVVTLDQMERLVAPLTFQPYFWARFAQPTVIGWSRDSVIQERLIHVLAQAAWTTVEAASPLLPPGAPADQFWPRAFAETYRTELRAEGPTRGVEIWRTDPERYQRVLALVRERLPAPGADTQRRAMRGWRWRRVQGKLLSVLRLIKNAFTFEDGADYLAWKIERHSGVRLELSRWQRRHPILASGVLFWRLYRAGGFR
jgi:hypothetical protein